MPTAGSNFQLSCPFFPVSSSITPFFFPPLISPRDTTCFLTHGFLFLIHSVTPLCRLFSNFFSETSLGNFPLLAILVPELDPPRF